jgi:chromosome segregation ATPase
MRAAHTAEAQQKDTAHEEQATALRKQLLDTGNKLEITEKELTGLKEEHTAALGDLSQTRTDLQQSQSDHDETAKRMAEERAASEESLTAAHRESAETLASSHADEMEALQVAAATEKAAAEERYEDLSATFADLKCRFDARESREEDLERIAELEETVIQKEGEVAATVGQMGQMKAELNNRESSFNKTFANGGERPVVAGQDQIMSWMLKSKNKNKENKKKGPAPARRSSVV